MTEAFKGPHTSSAFKEMAEAHTILRTEVGSGLHGIAIAGTDDRDEMGICIEPRNYVIGLDKFEQYEFRTQPQGVRSGPGDLDLNIYSLRKWMRLTIHGNPTGSPHSVRFTRSPTTTPRTWPRSRRLPRLPRRSRPSRIRTPIRSPASSGSRRTPTSRATSKA